MAAESTPWTWKDVVARLRDEPIDTVVQIAVSAIEEPPSVGLHPMPTGADGRPVFGALLDEQMGILVQVSGESYEARLCRLPQPATAPPPPVAAPPPPSPPALRQPTNLSPAPSPVAVSRRANSSPPSSMPVLVESRAELAVRRQSESLSLASFPAELPGTTMLATTLLGTIVGAALGGGKGALTGALVGGGAGLASIAVSTAVTSPATAFTAQTMFLALAAASLGGRAGGPVMRLSPAWQPNRPPLLDDGTPPRTRRLPPKK